MLATKVAIGDTLVGEGARVGQRSFFLGLSDHLDKYDSRNFADVVISVEHLDYWTICFNCVSCTVKCSQKTELGIIR